jgi:hypothetical protein
MGNPTGQVKNESISQIFSRCFDPVGSALLHGFCGRQLFHHDRQPSGPSFFRLRLSRVLCPSHPEAEHEVSSDSTVQFPDPDPFAGDTV